MAELNLKDKTKWHKRHVTIDTPCRLNELEAVIRSVGEQGWWDSAEVTLKGDTLTITYGNEEE